MSEFDNNPNEVCRYAKNPDMGVCKKCAEEYKMPHLWCCLEWCGELEFCNGCVNGIYIKQKA